MAAPVVAVAAPTGLVLNLVGVVGTTWAKAAAGMASSRAGVRQRLVFMEQTWQKRMGVTSWGDTKKAAIR
jgi:hypothetical protein